MRLVIAWYKRNFCKCINYYGEPLKIGEVYLKLITKNVEYIYVGKNKLLIKITKNENTI